MQSTSATYKAILAGDHHKEYKVAIDGVDYGENYLVSMGTSLNLMGGSSSQKIGNAVSRQIDISLRNPSVRPAKMAEIVPKFRLVSDVSSSVSEWLPKSHFFIDTRTIEHTDIEEADILTIHGYDAMMKTTQALISSEGEYARTDWPKTELQVVNIIASKIGVQVDPRTTAILTAKSYKIDYPGYASDTEESTEGVYSMHDILCAIGAAHLGNFIITDENKLRLVSIFPSLTPTNYLIEEHGRPLLFGNIRILV